MQFQSVDDVIRFIYQNILLVGLAMSFGLYWFAGKTEELSKQAARNTMATICVFAFNMFCILQYHGPINAWLQSKFDLLGIPKLPENTWEGLPLLLVCILGLIVKDFADYWNHRLMHTKWGWPTHAAHHSDTHVNALTAYRIHFLEMFVMSASYIVLLSWMQMPAAIPIVALFAALHNMYVHMDVDWRHGPFKLLIASPYFHRWHHADTPEAYGMNLANIMPLWDWLFGTYRDPGKIEAPMGLLASGHPDTNPIGIILYPFLQWGRMIRLRWRRLKKRLSPPAPVEETLPEVYPGE